MIKIDNLKGIIFIFLMMFLTAFCDSVRGVFIPVFKQDFNITDTTIGLVLMVCSLGYILFSYIGGILCEKIGQKKVFYMGFIFIFIALMVLFISGNFTVFLIGMFVLNMGQALMGIATNTLVPILFLSFQAILMNLTHFCYGIGSTFAQRFAGIMLYKGYSWRSIYLYIAIYALIIFLGFIFIRIPEPEKDCTNQVLNKKELFSNKLFYFYIIALGFYVFSEMGTGNWFVNFMEKTYNYNKSQSSFYLALFFGLFAVGRLVGGFIIEKLGYLNTTITFLSIALILYISGLILGDGSMAIISVSGFFFSITFPTMILTISRVFTVNSSYITGLIITFTSMIAMVLNLLIGKLNDSIGVYTAYYMIPISLLISIWFIVLIHANTKNILNRNGR